MINNNNNKKKRSECTSKFSCYSMFENQPIKSLAMAFDARAHKKSPHKTTKNTPGNTLKNTLGKKSEVKSELISQNSIIPPLSWKYTEIGKAAI